MACHSRNSDTTGVCYKNSDSQADMEDEEQRTTRGGFGFDDAFKGSACNKDLKCASNGGQFVKKQRDHFPRGC